MADAVIGRVTRSDAIKFPIHSDDKPEELGKCSECHDQKSNPADAYEFVLPFFSHVRHVSDHNAACADCHPAVDKKSFFPAKENCLACHTPAPHKLTGTSCTTCHAKVEAKATLPLPLFAKHAKALSVGGECGNCHEIGDQKVEVRLHPAGWIETHGEQRSLKRELCFVCHDNPRENKSCVDCHARTSLSPAPHAKGNNFRYYLHKLAARKKIVDCSTCHDRRTFCAPCHATYKRLPETHFVPGFDGTRHGRMARQDPEYCAACHGMGRTCFGCHPGGIVKR